MDKAVQYLQAIHQHRKPGRDLTRAYNSYVQKHGERWSQWTLAGIERGHDPHQAGIYARSLCEAYAWACSLPDEIDMMRDAIYLRLIDVQTCKDELRAYGFTPDEQGVWVLPYCLRTPHLSPFYVYLLETDRVTSSFVTIRSLHVTQQISQFSVFRNLIERQGVL